MANITPIDILKAQLVSRDKTGKSRELANS